MSSSRRLLLACVAACLFLVFTHSWWLTAMGEFLIDAGPPEKADLGVVLAGDWSGLRILKGGELVRQGYVPHAIVSGPPHHYGEPESTLAIRFAEKQGYPAASFIPFPHESDSTVDEAEKIAVELRQRGVRSILLITSDYHTRRAGKIWRATVPEIKVTVVAAPDRYFRADGWWLSRPGRKTAFYEWVKTVTGPFGV